MQQGRRLVVLALAVALALAVMPTAHALAGTPRAAAASPAKHRAAALHQFTGVVTALDKGTLTVAKAGKSPKSMVFARHAEMKTSGALEKDVHVTVWYRDEDGHPVAHKVVVKTGAASEG